MQPVTPYLNASWVAAVDRARRKNASPIERVVGLARARAGKGVVARFTPGEAARLARLTEEQVHDAVEAAIEARRLGADSHPQLIIVLDHLPEYMEPTEPGPIPPNMEVHKRVYRGNVYWQLRPAKAAS